MFLLVANILLLCNDNMMEGYRTNSPIIKVCVDMFLAIQGHIRVILEIPRIIDI